MLSLSPEWVIALFALSTGLTSLLAAWVVVLVIEAVSARKGRTEQRP